MELKFGDLMLKKLQVYIRILKLAKRPTEVTGVHKNTEVGKTANKRRILQDF